MPTRFALNARGRRQCTPDGDAVLIYQEGSQHAVEWAHVSEAEPFGNPNRERSAASWDRQ